MDECKFCRDCGKELVKREVSGFNCLTGEKNTALFCPSKPEECVRACNETPEWHQFHFLNKEPKNSFWKRLFHSKVCWRCGYDIGYCDY